MPRSRRHYRVTLADAISAHEHAINEFGGLSGTRDIGLVEAAVARPYNGYYRPVHRKAAALIESITANHGFADGNKRRALILFYLLLEKCGYMCDNTSTRQDEDDIEHLILDLTTHFLTFDEVCAWLKLRIRPAD